MITAPVAVLAAATLVAGVGCTIPASEPSPTPGPDRATFPSLRVGTAVRGLDIPWDVQQLPSGALLVSERDRRRLLLKTRGGVRVVADRPVGIWSSGETGLMSIQLAPSFATTGRFFTCHGAATATHRDIRVVAWRLNDRRTHARRVDVLLSGIRATSGRHGGCRLLLGRDGALYVGTGDAATSWTPQNRRSLNGKVLRLDPATGRPWPTNPWIHAANRRKRYVLTYGHRNVQGLAQRPGGPVWSVEHGPTRDDEVNLLRAGGNYGWDPGPGYDENVPMTDFSLPGKQRAARWRSGYPTVATSGATWVRGRGWGRYRGTLAVACLKASRVIFMRFDRRGRLLWTHVAPELTRYGRLRSITRAANGDLLVTTANGGGSDTVLRVHPR